MFGLPTCSSACASCVTHKGPGDCCMGWDGVLRMLWIRPFRKGPSGKAPVTLRVRVRPAPQSGLGVALLKCH